MASIPVIPYGVAVGASVDIVSVDAINSSTGGMGGRLSVRGPRRQFTCTVGPDDTPGVRSIFYTHRRRWPVAIRDWGDYIFEDEVLTYSAGGSGYLAPLRRLVQPAPGTRYYHQRVLIPDEIETPIVLKVNGVAISRSNWAFDNYGIVDIATSYVPSGAILTWSGNALVPVCFLDDNLSVQINVQQTASGQYGVQSIPTMRLEEILEEELINLMSQTDDSQ